MIHKNSTYPKLYRKVNPGDCPEPFVSVHLKQQSIISDPETGTRKSAVIPKHPAEYQKVKTVKDLFENGLRQSRFYPCLGRRSRFQDPFSWLLYHEVDMKMQAIGSALLKFVRKDVTCDNFVGIFGRNCAEWIIMQQACASYGYTVVPLYSTLGNEAMQHILLQTKMKCLMCSSGTEALQVMDHLESSIECLIIVSRDDKFNEVRFRYSSNVMIFSFDDFAKLGMNSLVPKMEPLPTDLFMINYTSGTTGLPKGVMVQHGQFVGSIITLLEMTEFKMNFTNSTHLSYLPLAHIMEQLISSFILLVGGRLGFLTEAFDGLMADAKTLRPTMFAAVPRVLSRMYTKYQKVLSESKLKTKLYNRILKIKMAEQKRGKFNHQSVLDELCFRKIRKMLGGRVCFVMVGAAPTPPEVMQFARAVFNVVLEGYGSTETMGCISVSLVGEYHLSVAGAIACDLEVKLTSVPGMQSIMTQNQKGEICVRGNRCTKGYYQDPVKTAELIDSDGWLHTGDVGEWTPEGSLKIVDRVKSIFKLAQGEYIAPEKIEMVYQLCTVVSQIFVDGNSQNNYPVAIVVPDFTELRANLMSAGLIQFSKLSNSELCTNETVNKFILDKLNAVADKKELKGFEKVKVIHLSNEEFTTTNGLLTPTNKLSRNQARKHFSNVINNLYKEFQPTIVNAER